MRTESSKFGFTIIEIILAMGLFVLIVGGAVGAVVQAFSVNRLAEEESYAKSRASEGLEAVRSITNRDYFNLTNGSHGLSRSGGFWEFSSSSDSLGKYTRRIVISNVFRDAGGNIIESGGTLDLFTKRAEAEVTWNFSPARNNSVSLTTYFTHWTESLCEWDSAVQVGGLDLPGTGDAQDIDVVGNKAYVISKKNGSAGEFFILSLSNPDDPVLQGEYEVSDHVNAVAVSGNFAYLATSKSGEELTVVNISNPSAPTQAALVDIPNVSQAFDVAVSGSYAYLVTPSSTGGGEFYIYDISNPSAPVFRSDFELGSHVYGVYVSGSRAYLSSSKVDKELVILDVSNPVNPTEIGSFNIPLAGANGQSIFYGGGVVHLTTRENGEGIAEYYLLEASDPENIN